MENPGHPGGFASLDPERHDVLDLEVDRVADSERVTKAFLLDGDGRPLYTEVLAHQWPERLHRASKGAREHLAELRGLFVGRGRVDEHAKLPVAVSHHLRRVHDRRDREAADVDLVDLPAL